MNKFADLHSHCSLLSFNSGVKAKYNKNLDEIDQPDIKDMVNEEGMFPAKYSQADFGSLNDAGVKLVFASLYPVERNFFEPKGLLKIIKWLGLEKFVLNIDKKRIKEIEADKKHENYFKELNSEYELLKENQSTTMHPLCNTPYQIVSTYEHLSKLQSDSPDTIAVVLTIEGASAFGISDKSIVNTELKTKVLNNINTVKDWSSKDGKSSYCPLFVTFCHHFYNNLAGHSLSSPNVNIDQKKGINDGFTDFGKQVLKKLLSKNEGKRRILIDIKHMSIASRKEYYQFLEDNYKENEIPIIASHCAVNGHAGFSEACSDINISDKSKPKDIKKGPIAEYEKSQTLNPWSINLFDNEIIQIHKSKGLMGIIMDQRVLAGGLKVYEVKKKYTWSVPEPFDDNDWFGNKQFQFDWTELYFKQIVHIYNVLLNNATPAEECFNSICIGSDFDGMINAIDAVNTSTRFAILEQNLILHITKNKVNFKEALNKISPEEIVEKIMYKNVVDFYKYLFTNNILY